MYEYHCLFVTALLRESEREDQIFPAMGIEFKPSSVVDEHTIHYSTTTPIKCI